MALALRARPGPDLTYVVSDAMPTVGGPDHFRLYDMDLRVEDGRLVNPEGSLAGAHVTMAESVARLVARVGMSPETGAPHGRHRPRAPDRPPRPRHAVQGRDAADLLLLEAAFAVGHAGGRLGSATRLHRRPVRGRGFRSQPGCSADRQFA